MATPACTPDKPSCLAYDAIVFVHGIYGGAKTFTNSATGFDWPSNFPPRGQLYPFSNTVDLFRLNYRTALLSWAKADNPDFAEVARHVFKALYPLRQRRYATIGFIAHSLGGNIVFTYLTMVVDRLGHSYLAQNAFVITLATPVVGAEIADIAHLLKGLLGINDKLLTSLENNNLYLRMLQIFVQEARGKGGAFGCRPLDLHAAIETKHIGPLLVVSPTSAALPIADAVNSPIIGFDRNHMEMATPSGTDDELYKWVLARVTSEYARLHDWGLAHLDKTGVPQRCRSDEGWPSEPNGGANPF
ncbi:MAG TPA: hypothetical protein VHR45_20805 [Thermoanaerobaculia bacterium]|nr:hypothetical protein [Thermoanaerobaculia bacterium]